MVRRYWEAFKSLITSKARLQRDAQRLSGENNELRERLATQQHAKALAQKQAEKLRDQKENLRDRVALLKKELHTKNRELELAQEKIVGLRRDLEVLTPCKMVDMSSDTKFLAVGPIGDTDPNKLPVGAIGPGTAFYVHVLGFTVTEREGKRAFLKRDEVTIGLTENGGDPNQASVYFAVEGIDALRKEFELKGIDPTEFRIDEYGGKKYRVFFAKEPYGVCFCFTEPVFADSPER